MRYALLVLLLGLLTGCGTSKDPRVTQNPAPGAGQLTISGFVSMVQVATAGTNSGPNSPVTMVTFISQIPQAGPLGTVTFCGDVSTQFIPNTFATVNFTQGQGCSTIVSLQT